MAKIRIGLRTETVRWLVACAVLGYTPAAHGGGTTLAEPVVEENITDVDATAIGTIETDLTGATIAPRNSPRAGSWTSGVEAEWRPIDRLGIGGGLVTGGGTSGLVPESVTALTPHVAASFVSLRDQRRKLFLQWEASARYPKGEVSDPTDPALPVALGVRWAAEVGPFTLRAGEFAEAGGTSTRLPIRQSYAVLLMFLSAPSRLYLGGEFIEDWARRSPGLLIPETLLLTRFLGEPIRLGVGVPVTFSSRATDRDIGLAFRLVIEPDE